MGETLYHIFLLCCSSVFILDLDQYFSMAYLFTRSALIWNKLAHLKAQYQRSVQFFIHYAVYHIPNYLLSDVVFNHAFAEDDGYWKTSGCRYLALNCRHRGTVEQVCLSLRLLHWNAECGSWGLALCRNLWLSNVDHMSHLLFPGGCKLHLPIFMGI